MPMRLHKKEERPQPAAVTARPRVSKTHGFPRFVLFVIVVAGLVVGGWYALTWNKVQVRGIVIAEQSEFITEARCRITTVNVKVGQAVKAGEVLLVSDSIDPRSQIPTYEAAVQQAELRLQLASLGGDVGEVDLVKRSRRLADAREAVDVSQARLEAAQKSEAEYMELVKAIAADRRKEIETAAVGKQTALEKLNQARASEKEVTVELEQAKLNYDKAKTLFALDAATLNDLQIAETKYKFVIATDEKVKSSTLEARKTLDGIDQVLKAVTEKYDAELDAQRSRHQRAQAETEVARAFLRHAQVNLTRAESEYGVLDPDFKKMQTDELDLLRQRVQEARGNLRYYKALAGTIEFKAPFDGVVGELNKQTGDVAKRDEKVISVYNPKTVAVEVYVPEDEYRRLAVGQKVEVKMRGSGERFRGTLVNVNRSPERLPGLLKVPTAPERAHDLYYYCRVEVPPEDQEKISPAMRANVTIYVD
ncbi:MAG TPA: HlyD family efflux transporter periplasmic adaptor subunit [Planctomycetota bacterium]|nr:HlyD family efflux transporter periplasmic adaptor subunit [Planctomycetota bacterium]